MPVAPYRPTAETRPRDPIAHAAHRLVDDAEAQAARTARPGGRTQQRAQSVRTATATTDHLTPIALSHNEVNHGLAALLADGRRHLVGVLDHRPRNAGNHLCCACVVAHGQISRGRGRWR